MQDTMAKDINDALRIVEEDIHKPLKNNICPNVCRFLDNVNIQLDPSFKEAEEYNKYFKCKRIVFGIELPCRALLNPQTSIEKLIKEKFMMIKNLGKDEKSIEMKFIKWVEFLKRIDSKEYMIPYLGLTNKKDSYQVFLSIYYSEK